MSRGGVVAHDAESQLSPARLRGTLAAVWMLVVVGFAGAVRVMWWYWPGSFFDGITSNVWTALAWDVAHGELYRPLLSPDGYGGTRYMPLLFVVHGLLIRGHVDAIYAGIGLMQASVLAAVLALFVALRAANVPARLALPLACTVWCTVVYQKYCTDIRADYLAAALALGGAGLAFSVPGRRRPLWLAVGVAACVLAGLTKVTAVVFVAPIAIWLFVGRRRDLALWFAIGTVTLFAVGLGIVQFASAGHFLENFRATITGGMTVSDLWRAIPKVGEEVVSDPFVAAPFALACWAVVIAARRRSLSFAHAYFVVAALVTLALFASPGIVTNQLVDLHMAATLVVGAGLARGDISPRVFTPTYAALAILLAVISIPAPGIPSVMATLQAQGPRQRSVVRAIHDEFLPAGTRYLSTDPIVPVLNDERAVLVDAFNLERFLKEGAPAGLDIAERVRVRAFDAIILRDTPDFPHDATAGDAGFDEARARYWAKQNGGLAQLFRSMYDVRAVRKPFVILRPRAQ